MTESSPNNIMTLNTLDSNSNGIKTLFSDNNTLESNTIYNNLNDGMYVNSSSNNQIRSNIIYQNTGNGIEMKSFGSSSGYVFYCNNESIASNIIYNNQNNVILSGFTNSIIQGNIIYDSIGSGISFDGLTGYSSSNNTLDGNIIHDTACGFYIWGGNNNALLNSLAYNNNYAVLAESYNSTIESSTLRNNTIGIEVYNGAHITNIMGNNIYHNLQSGVDLEFGSNATVKYNTISYNGLGINASTNFPNITIDWNTISNNNGLGIELGDNPLPYTQDNLNYIDHNNINNDTIALSILYENGTQIKFNNMFNNLDYGIEFNAQSSENYVYHNNLINDTYFGLVLYSSYNNITRNDFIGNINPASQAYDSGSVNSYTYNYYGDENTTDMNADGIADNPYSIAGSANAMDNYTVIFPNSVPKIVVQKIIFPTGGVILNGIEKVSWTTGMDNFDLPVFYNISVSSNNGMTWKNIASNLKSSSFQWNTSSLLNGQYILKITAYDRNNTSTSIITKSAISIKNAFLTSPKISSPKGGEILHGMFTIQWNKSIDGLGNQVSYEVFYSSNDGDSWNILAKNTTTTSFRWDTTKVPEGDTYLLWIKAGDGHGLTSQVKSEATFSVHQFTTSSTSSQISTSTSNSGSTSTSSSSSLGSFSLFDLVLFFPAIIVLKKKKISRKEK